LVAASRRAAEGAQVLLIMTDDDGFGAPGTFGGVIPTLDRSAKTGCVHKFSLHVPVFAHASSFQRQRRAA